VYFTVVFVVLSPLYFLLIRINIKVYFLLSARSITLKCWKALLLLASWLGSQFSSLPRGRLIFLPIWLCGKQSNFLSIRLNYKFHKVDCIFHGNRNVTNLNGQTMRKQSTDIPSKKGSKGQNGGPIVLPGHVQREWEEDAIEMKLKAISKTQWLAFYEFFRFRGKMFNSTRYSSWIWAQFLVISLATGPKWIAIACFTPTSLFCCCTCGNIIEFSDFLSQAMPRGTCCGSNGFKERV